MDIGGEEKKKKSEVYEDADIDEREPETDKKGNRAGGESSDEEAVVNFAVCFHTMHLFTCHFVVTTGRG